MGALVALLLGGLAADPLLPGKPFVLRGHTDAVTAVAFTPDGKRLLSGGRDKAVRVWDLEHPAPLATWPGVKQQVSGFSFSADGALVAVGDVAFEARVQATADGAVKHAVAFSELVTGVALSPDGTAVAVAGNAGGAALIGLADGKRVELKAWSAAFTPDGKTLLLGDQQGLRFADPKTGRVRRSVPTPKHAPAVVVSADGRVLASWNGAETDVFVWDAAGKPLATLSPPKPAEPGEGARPTVTSISLSADGSRLAVATADHAVRVWDVARKAVLRAFPLQAQGFLSLSPDGAWVAVGDGAVVKVWKVD